eukprot:CAMPEP_0194753598 /NCGR_PEP_ID=MMETSP0323_2-20130528/7555_1 /TAXON_ID=2866 ORGANISM="Crypthecodinium cohnii, Strain Seligo" /NCGR_SAMPLE_ID=MMETSP0323_2 /ASSEMBLY_ACC=CAM_ASM_000346 /LENGTH=35 /DNA_ID= /DNA_START= /DNA_END= /DNA_ORIENTATION=
MVGRREEEEVEVEVEKSKSNETFVRQVVDSPNGSA